MRWLPKRYGIVTWSDGSWEAWLGIEMLEEGTAEGGERMRRREARKALHLALLDRIRKSECGGVVLSGKKFHLRYMLENTDQTKRDYWTLCGKDSSKMQPANWVPADRTNGSRCQVCLRLFRKLEGVWGYGDDA